MTGITSEGGGKQSKQLAGTEDQGLKARQNREIGQKGSRLEDRDGKISPGTALIAKKALVASDEGKR